MSYANRVLENMVEKLAKDLTAQGRKHIKEKNFAIPGKEKYPIHDMAHARNALARVSQNGTAEERRLVREKVYRRYPSLREEFENKHGVSPLAKKVLTKKTTGQVSKSASMAAESVLTAFGVASDLPAEYAGPTIKAAASRLVEAYYAGKAYGE